MYRSFQNSFKQKQVSYRQKLDNKFKLYIFQCLGMRVKQDTYIFCILSCSTFKVSPPLVFSCRRGYANAEVVGDSLRFALMLNQLRPREVEYVI
jgi:hypothetical protein